MLSVFLTSVGLSRRYHYHLSGKKITAIDTRNCPTDGSFILLTRLTYSSIVWRAAKTLRLQYYTIGLVKEKQGCSVYEAENGNCGGGWSKRS